MLSRAVAVFAFFLFCFALLVYIQRCCGAAAAVHVLQPSDGSLRGVRKVAQDLRRPARRQRSVRPLFGDRTTTVSVLIYVFHVVTGFA